MEKQIYTKLNSWSWLFKKAISGWIIGLFVLGMAFHANAQSSKEYTDADAASLVTDIEAGTYDEYILSSSGGTYLVKDIDLASNVVVKAKDGLAEKPIFANPDNTGTFQAFFDVQNGAFTLEVDGIVFDGTATEPMIGVARLRANDASITIKNCEIKNFTTNNGFVRLDNAGTAITVDNSFVHNCFGRLIRINNNGAVFGEINITNSTFAKITDDPVIHWVTTTSSTVAKITIDQCTFYDVNDLVFKLGDLDGDLSVSNSIFDVIADGISMEVPGTNDVIDYSYTTGLAGTIPTEFAVTNGITTAPEYTDAANLDLTLLNASMLTGMSGDPIGDPRWVPAQVSSTVVSYAEQTVTNAADQVVTLQSSADAGSVYIILDGEAQSTVEEFETAVSASKGAKATVTAANTDVNVSTNGLIAGTYYGYAVDATENISEKGINPLTIIEATIPVAVANAIQTVTNAKGQVALVQSNKPDGMVYIVLDGETQATVADFEAAIAAKKASSATVTANDIDMSVPTDSLTLGVYYAYAVDADGNISDKGTNAITITKGAPEVYADAQTATDAVDQFVFVQSSDNQGKVYIILDGELQDSIPAFEAAVAAGKGAVAEVTAALTDIPVSTTGLASGIYYAYATDAVGNVSAKGSNKLTVLSSTLFAKEYTDAEVDALAADITAGLYEMYVLSSTGGVYDLPSIPDISKSAVIMAKPGLAEKPVLKCSANTSTSFGTLRVRNATEDVELVLQGIEFDCTGSPGNVLRADSKTHLVLRDCYIHDNTNSNGSLRLNTEGSSVEMENCFVADCKQRVVCLYTNTVNYGDIVLSNSTFVRIAGEGVVFFRSSGTYAGGEDVIINHCTFSEVGGNIFRYDKSMIAGTVSVTNSLFDQVADSLNVDVLDYNYLDVALLAADAGTNTFTTVPVFVDSTNYNYGLSNRTSYVCGDGETVGDLTWYAQADSLIAILYPQKSTNLTNDVVKAQANVAEGMIYLVRMGEDVSSVTALDATVAASKGAKASIAAAFTDVEISVTGLYSGTYYAYVVGVNGEISDASQYSATILDWLNIQYAEQTVSNGVGKFVEVVTSVDATAYIVKEGDYTSIEDLEAAVSGNRGNKAEALAETPVTISVEGLQTGTYYGYAVSDTNISLRGENPIFITTAVYVENASQTATNKDDNWGFAYVKAGTVGGNVYLLHDEFTTETITVDVLESALASQMAVKDTVKEAEVNFKVSTDGLLEGSYHFYMVKGTQVSEPAASGVWVREPKVYYFAAEQAEEMRAAFYNASITTGDEVILTTSGGIYNLKTYFRIYGGVYLHAQKGLAEKPVLFYNPNSGGEDARSFLALIEYYPPGGYLEVSGIELNGGGTDSITGNATFGFRVREDADFNYGVSIKFNDCYFHDFNTENTNSAGVVSNDGYVYRQSNNVMADSVIFSNCIVKNTYNPAIYFRNLTGKDYFNSLKISNSTLYEVPSVLNVSAPIASTQAKIYMNHLTLDSIGQNTPAARIVSPDKLPNLMMWNSVISNSCSNQVSDTALWLNDNAQVLNCNFFNGASIEAGLAQVSNTTTLDPGYYNRDAYNYAITNTALHTAGTDGLQLGDLRWVANSDFKVEPELRFVNDTVLKMVFNQAVDSVSAKVLANYTLSGTAGLTGNPIGVTLASFNEVLVTVPDFSSAVDFSTVVVSVSNITNVMGDAVITEFNNATYVVPIAVTMATQKVANEQGQVVKATCGSANSSIYLVPGTEIILGISDLDKLLTEGIARVAVVSEAMVDAEIDVADLEPGMYYTYAVDAEKSQWSSRSANGVDVRGLEVTMDIQLGKTNGPGETVTVQSSYNHATVYLIADSIAITSVADFLLAVENKDAVATDAQTAFADLTIAIEGINPGRYRAYAVSGDSISEKSNVPVQIDKFVGIDDHAINKVDIFAYKNKAYIKCQYLNKASIKVYTLNGRLIYTKQMNTTTEEIALDSGLFIIRVETDEHVITQKVSTF